MWKKMRWIAAAGIVYLMGFPMAEKAAASGIGDIFDASLSLAAAIVDVAGNS
ncbi:MAG TPA: hypothetical protein P5572_14535 [Phycisphaerae bacterium]|nr:hypothetical protein [Phycisphaerae bacterium]